MLRLFKLTLICALALAAHAQTPSKAQLDADQAATLKGIQEIAVVVDVNKVFLSNGLTAEQLQTDIELRLRKAGIAVVDATTVMREAMSRPTYDDETKRLIKRVMDLAVLNISVSGGTTTSQSSLFFVVLIELRQAVTIDRNQKKDRCTTWENNAIGTLGVGRVLSLKDDVGDLTDRFLNAYLSVNPPVR